jgi:hypothetical protein
MASKILQGELVGIRQANYLHPLQEKITGASSSADWRNGIDSLQAQIICSYRCFWLLIVFNGVATHSSVTDKTGYIYIYDTTLFLNCCHCLFFIYIIIHFIQKN